MRHLTDGDWWELECEDWVCIFDEAKIEELESAYQAYKAEHPELP